MLTPEQRSQRARIAANARWAKEADGLAATAKARSEFLNRFEAEVDPEGKYPPEIRRRMAENARRRYYQTLAFRSSRARQARKEAREQATAEGGAA